MSSSDEFHNKWQACASRYFCIVGVLSPVYVPCGEFSVGTFNGMPLDLCEKCFSFKIESNIGPLLKISHRIE